MGDQKPRFNILAEQLIVTKTNHEGQAMRARLKPKTSILQQVSRNPQQFEEGQSMQPTTPMYMWLLMLDVEFQSRTWRTKLKSNQSGEVRDSVNERLSWREKNLLSADNEDTIGLESYT
ncbi:hypothetical protein OHC33_001593 [Knufia fluminis]|uniref:Uncharacterized protein n=1 Tax=Knufia fluminis TaxID=191047 RepID=A0AAN8ERS1_9EURO|nr:hypothetical protein OHC33_001593 [Knufia fluminis]